MFWILLGLFIKCLPFLFLLHHRPPSDIPGIWAGTMDYDSRSYLDPVDNLLRTGHYSPDIRMPGYSFIYFFLRIAFAHDYACNILIILQFIFAGISVYYLALTAKSIFKNTSLFYVCFYLFLVSTYSNYFDGWIMTESFCNSALIFSTWFFAKYFESGKLKHLLFSGLFITWTIFLRPVFIPLIFLFPIVLILQGSTEKIKMRDAYKRLIICLLPFFLIDGSWIAYNYVKHQRITVLAPSMYIPVEDTTYLRPLDEFITSWGGSANFCDSNSYMFWFGSHFKDAPIPKGYAMQIPANSYTSQFNGDSLLILKNKITAINDSSLPVGKARLYQLETRERLARYTRSVKQEKPFMYYVESRFCYALPLFLFGPESRIYMKRFNLPGRMVIISEGIFALLYYAILLLGITGTILLLIKEYGKNKMVLIISFIPLYIITVHAIVLRFSNTRYLIPSWAFLILCTSYLIVFLSKKKKGEKSI